VILFAVLDVDDGLHVRESQNARQRFARIPKMGCRASTNAFPTGENLWLIEDMKPFALSFFAMSALLFAEGVARAEHNDGQPSWQESWQAPKLSAFQVRLVAEGGFVSTLSNFGEFGAQPTRIDFRTSAGQDNLNFYTRWSAELELGKRHTVVALYQPLASTGTWTPSEDVRFGGVAFNKGAPLATSFSFPYYRLSYLYELWTDDGSYLSLGASGQIRNANNTVATLDGTRFARSSNVGFVPALKVRGEWSVTDSAYLGVEADGIYAPISVLNGSDNDTVGAILDASLRVGVKLSPRASAFLNVRYLGGGATNTDPNDYAKNWLHFFFVGLGATYDLVPRPTRTRTDE
jgi:hypothetical protein